MDSPNFQCSQCGRPFQVRPDVLARYPSWRPSLCLDCKKPRPNRGAPKPTRELALDPAEVLERFHKGPQDGVFTDGACEGNPGPGGWGMVWVEGGTIVAERRGHEPHTTNNRMELTALIEAYKLLPPTAELTVWTDSNLCVRTINEWAEGWKRRGWKRKEGPVANLELVRELYELARAHPKVALRWIKAHDGSRWNEYADALATAYQRA